MAKRSRALLSRTRILILAAVIAVIVLSILLAILGINDLPL